MSGMRAADSDRERVAAALREEMAVGRLTLEEFDERLSSVYAAKTWDELRAQLTDLPVDITFEGETRRPRPSGMSPPVPRTAAPPMGPQPGGRPVRRVPWFTPFLLIPLFGMGIAVTHGAFGALIPMFLIIWFVLGVGRGRRRYHYH